jgi:hypothetical protein
MPTVILNLLIVCIFDFEKADMLVLFSRKDSVWKIGDFGLTTEASSTRNRITRDARGTPGYRAPELVVPDGTCGFSSKSDIWSIGCLLYELATRKPAFASDGSVLEYRWEGRDKVVELEDIFDVNSKEVITKHIVTMLQVEPSTRPPARTLVKEFTRHCERLPNQTVIEDLNDLEIAPLVPRTSFDADEVTQTMGDDLNDLEITPLVPRTAGSDVTEVKGVLATEGYKGVEGLYLRRKALLQGPDPEFLYYNFHRWWAKTSHPLLLEAASKGDMKLLRELMQAYVDITTPTKEGRTALHLASAAGHIKVVKILLRTMARLDPRTHIVAKDICGWNSLHEAALRGFTEIVQLFLDASPGPRPDQIRLQIISLTPIVYWYTNAGETALFLAVSRGHSETVKRLLSVTPEFLLVPTTSSWMHYVAEGI